MESRSSRTSPGRRSVTKRAWLVALAAGVFVVAVAWVAQAVVLTPTPNPLTGSNFQGGDGDQDNPAAPDIDWQALTGSADLETLNDPTGAGDNVINGKEDTPVDWDVQTGAANPGKSDILASWSLIDQDADGPFLYLAFARADAGGGNAFFAFELNQDKRLWLNAKGDLIQCRQDGDLIISYEVQNSSNIEVIAQEWNETSEVSAAEAAGGFTNGEGCSKTGNFIETDPGTANAEAAINAAGPVTNFLPKNPAVASFAAGRFGEAALRLAPILSGGGNNDACFSFGRLNMHSRTARSANSGLVDYTTSVGALARNCTISGTKWSDLDADGVRDAGEPGIANYVVYIDANHNNAFDPGEPTATTDAEGEYVFENVANGTYEVREAPDSEQITANRGLTCTFPNIPVEGCENDATITPADQNDDGNDFGNAGQGTITVVKDLNPSSDTGLFNLQIDGVTQASAINVGDGGTTGAIAVGPGDHTVGETAGTGTSLDEYEKSISCDNGTSVGVDNASLAVNVAGGQNLTCTITNLREAIIIPDLPPPAKRFCAVEQPTIRGTNGPDKIIGTPGNDVIRGRGGDDIVKGKGGRDLICPNQGDDIAKGGAGADTVRGGPDDDRLYGNGGSDFVHGYAGNDLVNGGPGKDKCKGGTGKTKRVSCEGR